MLLTYNDYLNISAFLKANAIKDSELPSITQSLPTDEVVLLHGTSDNKTNVKIQLLDLAFSNWQLLDVTKEYLPNFDGIKFYVCTDETYNLSGQIIEMHTSLENLLYPTGIQRLKTLGCHTGDLLIVLHIDNTYIGKLITDLQTLEVSNNLFIHGLMTSDDKALLEHLKFKSKDGQNLNTNLETGFYKYCTLGRPEDSEDGEWYSLSVKATDNLDNNEQYAIELTIVSRTRPNRVFYRLVFKTKENAVIYGDWIRLSSLGTPAAEIDGTTIVLKQGVISVGNIAQSQVLHLNENLDDKLTKLTANLLSAVNSGITRTKVLSYDEHITNISQVYQYKGSVVNKDALLEKTYDEGVRSGHVYNTEDTGMNYAAIVDTTYSVHLKSNEGIETSILDIPKTSISGAKSYQLTLFSDDSAIGRLQTWRLHIADDGRLYGGIEGTLEDRPVYYTPFRYGINLSYDGTSIPITHNTVTWDHLGAAFKPMLQGQITGPLLLITLPTASCKVSIWFNKDVSSEEWEILRLNTPVFSGISDLKARLVFSFITNGASYLVKYVGSISNIQINYIVEYEV